ncbi:polyphosphate polymerase domain-containing protein (plasmid) [Deinococcus taeanensis]|uniref:polyphosphate polymerase domain-containing protein n=1 Tax=Deinococcus taeanensis TaxID=2737050 RepID=UPI001CDD06DF|nr:polyphosphate polymerase domain-containing protein [Deinococcus taeanensis]UBV44850.1 polyphosphate polymerase domain-containing protein [Deinococcus taeanensis]
MPHSCAPNPAHSALHDALQGFRSISLADTQAAALMDRVEYKYLSTLPLVCDLLPALWAHYHALDISGTRLQGYSSVYHDTLDFSMYRAHHNGQARRHKVRYRQYRATGQTFMEVKLRDPKGRTRKERTLMTPGTDLPAAQAAFLAGHLPALGTAQLEPKLRVDCDRLTLVNVPRQERLTFDLNLTLSSPDGAVTRTFPDLVVIELKCAGGVTQSAFLPFAQQQALRGQPFSKYGVGCALLYPTLKRNAFKPQLLHLARLAQPKWSAAPGNA